MQLYQLRGALEGLAASLAASSTARPFPTAICCRRNARGRGLQVIAKLFWIAIFSFTCTYARSAGNPFVLEHARRVLLPFFAFVRMRVAASRSENLFVE